MNSITGWRRSLDRSFEASKRSFWDERVVLNRLLEQHGGITLAPERRAALREILALILAGEAAAVTIAGQLVGLVRDPEPRIVLAAQTFEEAKHVRAISRYLAELGGELPPANPRVLWVLGEIERTDDVVLKLFGMQLLAENLAHHLFHALRTRIREPVLAGLLEYMEADEAKHVGLARNYLPYLLRERGELSGLLLLARVGVWTVALMSAAIQMRGAADALELDLLGAVIRCARDHRKLILEMRRRSWTKTADLLMSDTLVRRIATVLFGRRADIETSECPQ
jgi:rubrerythrin